MRSIPDIITILRTYGISGTLGLILKKFTNRKVSNYMIYHNLFYDKRGIEIGGPSSFFKNEVPLYKIIKSLDGVNFSSSTIWEGNLTEGEYYKFGKRGTGYQYICDAVGLDRIKSGKYDFLLSCNNLEHIANPIKALNEWMRILKPGGVLLLVLPDKNSNFDHNRNYTSFEHLLEDFNNDVSEEDLTHLNEILEQHDLSLDPFAGDRDNFKKRSVDNFKNRCLHHHVFNMMVLELIFEKFKLEILLKANTKTDLIIVGKKEF